MVLITRYSQNARLLAALSQITLRAGQHMPVAVIQISDAPDHDLPFVDIELIGDVIGLRVITVEADLPLDVITKTAETGNPVAAAIASSDAPFLLVIDGDVIEGRRFSELLCLADCEQNDRLHGGVLIMTSRNPYAVAARAMEIIGATPDRIIV